MKFTIVANILSLKSFSTISQKPKNYINIKAIPKANSKIGFSSSQFLHSLNPKDVDIQLEIDGEISLFSTDKKVRAPKGFFHGSNDEKTLNLLAIDNNNMFGSVINVKENTIIQIQPNVNGEIVFLKKNIGDFNEALGVKDLNVKGNSFHTDISMKDKANKPNFVRRLNGKYNDLGDNIDVMVVWTKKV